ncbi:MAG: hypothetical protein U0934_04715 [Pseudotabrizicola sp.]|uniref:hypothetical protein n=1 Tax=Pseudotabrizicola sp. TaxID=2939647 RepID=UPI0027277423|nr:hypothetical protein [Pseudotabrizicola sp.]MDO8881487.1 hypothetical protein [Pseudotabrizicola sp.]MDP2082202.1 hypothetical protein [Pseudotabrizicola sp.]MDZ7573241.1 hypothetical protein [Pseudotabrizicola sp.]
MNVTLSLLAVLVTLLGPLGLVMSAAPVAGQPVLVIVPPWADAGAIIAQAGGQEISPLRAAMATLAYAEAPDFVQRLHQQGAWAVRNGSFDTLFCGKFL